MLLPQVSSCLCLQLRGMPGMSNSWDGEGVLAELVQNLLRLHPQIVGDVVLNELSLSIPPQLPLRVKALVVV